jgi:hypothetical protein
MNISINSILKSIALVIFFIPVLFSCGDDDVEQRKGSVSFGFSIIENSGRISQDISFSHLIISAENDNGTVFNDEEVPLISFDNEYATEPISLNAGSYRLTKFLVVGEDGTVHYATPVEGSELAYLVNDPLPIHIVVSKNEVIEVEPEVISTSVGSVEDFGYGEFGFNIIETFDVLLGVFVYDRDASNFALADAEITVFGNSDSLTSKTLFATTNKLTLPDRFEEFTLKITKDGYNPFSYTFSSDSIKSYQGDNENGPLEIVLTSLSISEGLIAYYPFNGNAIDESDNAYDGTVSGAILTSDRFGNPNSAYSFDGIDDYIKLGDDFDQESNSINVWFKIADMMIFENGETIIASDHANKVNGLWSITMRTDAENSQSPQLRFNRNGNGDVNLNPVGSDWYMATMTFDGSNYKYYINGVIVNSGLDQGNINSKDGISLATVGTTRKFDRYFNGLIDDIRIYNRALDVNEIITIYKEVE